MAQRKSAPAFQRVPTKAIDGVKAMLTNNSGKRKDHSGKVSFRRALKRDLYHDQFEFGIGGTPELVVFIRNQQT